MKQLGKNWLEWCVFGAGGVLVLATVGYLIYEAATSQNRPASLDVRMGAAERRGEAYAVPVTVINRGDEAAETVLLEVRLKNSDGLEERAELQIPLLPGKATRRGWVNFKNDPASAEMTARAVSFASP